MLHRRRIPLLGVDSAGSFRLRNRMEIGILLSGKPCFGEIELPADSLPEFLVDKAALAHSYDLSLSAINVPDIRSCHVRPSLSSSAHTNPKNRAEVETR